MAGEALVTHVLDVCARPECIERVHTLLAALWADAPEVDPVERMRFEIAVAEVAANIVEHAGGPRGESVDLSLRLSAYPDRVEACFRDTGLEARVDVDRAALPDATAERGRGIAMALAAVDEVDYLRDGEQNVWRLVQRHG